MERTGPKKIDRTAAKHYSWKGVCDGWHLVEHDALSVIAERMPPDTQEDMHYHRHAAQFFYLLSGRAVMRFPQKEELLLPGEGIEIPPLQPHQMTNPFPEDAEFLVVSSPRSHGDKICVEPN